MEATKQGNGWERINQIGCFLCCIMMADCCIFGAGRVFTLGPVSLRQACLALALLLAVPLVIRKRRELIRNKYLWVLVALLVLIVINTFVGLQNGNDYSVLMFDLKGFVYFVAILPFVLFFREEKQIHLLMKVMMYAALVQAVLTIGLALVYKFDWHLYIRLFEFTRNQQISMWCPMTDSICRMFNKSTPYMIGACCFALYFWHREQKLWRYSIIIGICLSALFFSFTRSIYLAVFVSVVMVLIVFVPKYLKQKSFWFVLGVSVLVCIVLIGGMRIVLQDNPLNIAIGRSVSMFTDARSDAEDDLTAEDQTDGQEGSGKSDAGTFEKKEGDLSQKEIAESVLQYEKYTNISNTVREKTMIELKERISDEPLFGNGLGLALQCRDDGRHEYFFLDVWMKMGLIGLVVYLLPVIMMLIALGKHWQKRFLTGVWLAFLLGLCAFSYFNPYMNAALGILVYCTTIAVCSAVYKDEEKTV